MRFGRYFYHLDPPRQWNIEEVRHEHISLNEDRSRQQGSYMYQYNPSLHSNEP